MFVPPPPPSSPPDHAGIKLAPQAPEGRPPMIKAPFWSPPPATSTFQVPMLPFPVALQGEDPFPATGGSPSTGHIAAATTGHMGVIQAARAWQASSTPIPRLPPQEARRASRRAKQATPPAQQAPRRAAPHATTAVLPAPSTEAPPLSMQGACTNPDGVVERVRKALASQHGVVACADAITGPRGWTITAYVHSQYVQACNEQLLSIARKALLAEAGELRGVCLIGYAAEPFIRMPLGFGCAVASVPSGATICKDHFANGFCSKPGTCSAQHPTDQVGISVMLKRAGKKR
uniref:C3H1-type domain-containing protein n=1 Tax=Zooxanthella nutricula TaxID=1333877 RepID=A0A7S2PKF9_9DINO